MLLTFTGRIKAWADTQLSVDWVKSALKPTAEQLGKFVLFCNNMEGQIIELFLSEVQERTE